MEEAGLDASARLAEDGEGVEGLLDVKWNGL